MIVKYFKPMAAAIVAFITGCATRPVTHTNAQYLGAVVITGPTSDAQTIVAIRDTLNRALRDRDVTSLARYWPPDVHITGGNGSLRVSRDSSMRAYAQFFADSTFVSGLRTPERIDVASNDVGQAAEAGRWVWRTRDERGVTESQGRYLVFWQRLAGGWRIRSELYVRTACISGPGCHRTGSADRGPAATLSHPAAGGPARRVQSPPRHSPGRMGGPGPRAEETNDFASLHKEEE